MAVIDLRHFPAFLWDWTLETCSAGDTGASSTAYNDSQTQPMCLSKRLSRHLQTNSQAASQSSRKAPLEVSLEAFPEVFSSSVQNISLVSLTQAPKQTFARFLRLVLGADDEKANL